VADRGALRALSERGVRQAIRRCDPEKGSSGRMTGTESHQSPSFTFVWGYELPRPSTQDAGRRTAPRFLTVTARYVHLVAVETLDAAPPPLDPIRSQKIRGQITGPTDTHNETRRRLSRCRERTCRGRTHALSWYCRPGNRRAPHGPPPFQDLGGLLMG